MHAPSVCLRRTHRERLSSSKASKNSTYNLVSACNASTAPRLVGARSTTCPDTYMSASLHACPPLQLQTYEGWPPRPLVELRPALLDDREHVQRREAVLRHGHPLVVLVPPAVVLDLHLRAAGGWVGTNASATIIRSPMDHKNPFLLFTSSSSLSSSLATSAMRPVFQIPSLSSTSVGRETESECHAYDTRITLERRARTHTHRAGGRW